MPSTAVERESIVDVLGPEYHKGTRLIAYPDFPLYQQIFIEVTRVARDGSWVDIACHTWAVRWTKRIPAESLGKTANRFHWDAAIFAEQEEAHMQALRDRGSDE